MNMHRNIIASQWEAALFDLMQAIAARDVVIKTFRDAQARHEADRPVDNYVAICGVGDTVEAYNARCDAAKAAHEKAEAAWRSNPDFLKAQREAGRAMAEVERALAAVLTMPAPNLAAVTRKIELMKEFEWESGFGLSDLDCVLTDLDRLALLH